MFDYAMIDHQINAYSNLISPIIEYAKQNQNLPLSENDIHMYIPVAKQTEFVLDGFLTIIDDLNYDKEKFENLIDTLDDDYEKLSAFTKHLRPDLFQSHKELFNISSKVLNHLVKGQFQLGAIISKHDNQAS